MLRAQSILRRFCKDESGATAIEYGLIAAMIFLVLIGALTAMGQKISGALQPAATALGQ